MIVILKGTSLEQTLNCLAYANTEEFFTLVKSNSCKLPLSAYDIIFFCVYLLSLSCSSIV